MNNFTRYSLVVVGILVLAGVVVYVFSKNISSPNRERNPDTLSGADHKYSTTLKIAEKIIQVDLALTPAERTKGLSGRKSLAANSGMLFIFDTPGIYSFWMADMFFPIDIIWIDEQKKIVHIESNVLPESFPTAFTSSAPAKYVLEVPAGFSDKTGLSVGNPVLF